MVVKTSEVDVVIVVISDVTVDSVSFVNDMVVEGMVDEGIVVGDKVVDNTVIDDAFITDSSSIIVVESVDSSWNIRVVGVVSEVNVGVPSSKVVVNIVLVVSSSSDRVVTVIGIDVESKRVLCSPSIVVVMESVSKSSKIDVVESWNGSFVVESCVVAVNGRCVINVIVG